MTDQYKPTPADQKRGRRMFLFMFVLFFGPFLMAALAKNFGWFTNTDTVNYGTLITPAKQLADSDFGLANKEASIQLRDKWSLLFFIPNQCEEQCLKGVRELEAIHLLLNRDIQRVQLLAINNAGIDLGLYTKQLSTGIKLDSLQNDFTQAQLPLLGAYLIDPKGFLVLVYPPNADGKMMQKDLKRLLKYSRIG